MAGMKKEERRKNTDPDKMRVEEWSEGKEKNVRALLSTLEKALWAGAEWAQVSFAALSDDKVLRKTYQKACLLTHPDRCQSAPHKDTANDIFVLINQAMEIEKNKG